MSSDEVATDTARILFLTYGADAVEMAELRCKELEAAGDAGGVATWNRVLSEVKNLSAGNSSGRDSVN